MAVHGTIDELAWESAFFGLRSAIIRLNPYWRRFCTVGTPAGEIARRANPSA